MAVVYSVNMFMDLVWLGNIVLFDILAGVLFSSVNKYNLYFFVLEMFTGGSC